MCWKGGWASGWICKDLRSKTARSKKRETQNGSLFALIIRSKNASSVTLHRQRQGSDHSLLIDTRVGTRLGPFFSQIFIALTNHVGNDVALKCQVKRDSTFAVDLCRAELRNQNPRDRVEGGSSLWSAAARRRYRPAEFRFG